METHNQFAVKSDQRRVLILVFGSAYVFFTGFPHIWSIYQPYVIAAAGWSQGQASLCFYLALMTFVLGNIAGGKIQRTYGLKTVMAIGSLLFVLGILLSAWLVIPSPVPMYLTYGIMQGTGQGMVYMAIVSAAQRWYPERTGFASGVIVTANGLCGVFLTPVSLRLLQTGGPKLAFVSIGTVAAVMAILAFLFVSNPEEAPDNTEKAGAARDYTSKQMLRTVNYLFLVVIMTCGLLPYFMLSPVSQVILTGKGLAPQAAAGAVMAGSILNGSIRLGLPTLADRFGHLRCMKVVAVIIFVTMILLYLPGSYSAAAAIVLTYGCYGGIMGCFPSLTSSIFGLLHSGENYGYVMFGMVAATLISPVIVSHLTAEGINLPALLTIGSIMAVLAFAFILLLDQKLKAQKMYSISRDK